MRAQHQDLAISIALEEVSAGVAGAGDIMVEIAGYVRQGALDRMMHQVAGDNGAVAARGDRHADMARRVPGRRFQSNVLSDLMIHLHQFVQVGFDNRAD